MTSVYFLLAQLGPEKKFSESNSNLNVNVINNPQNVSS